MAPSLQEASDAFVAAANRWLAGDPEAFAFLGSEADGISHLGPTGERHVGREAVLDGFECESRMGFTGPLRAEQRQFVEATDLGFVVGIKPTSGMSEAGEPIATDIRATTIFRREQDLS